MSAKALADLSKPIKRGPISLREVYAAELGELLEVETDTHQIRWPRHRVILYGEPETHAAIGLEGARKGKKVAADGSIAPKVADLFERWSGRSVRHARTDAAKASGKPQWRSFGRIYRFDYWSDKKGRQTEYTHDTDSVLYRFGGIKPPWVWVIRGKGLRITMRGFIG